MAGGLKPGFSFSLKSYIFKPFLPDFDKTKYDGWRLFIFIP